MTAAAALDTLRRWLEDAPAGTLLPAQAVAARIQELTEVEEPEPPAGTRAVRPSTASLIASSTASSCSWLARSVSGFVTTKTLLRLGLPTLRVRGCVWSDTDCGGPMAKKIYPGSIRERSGSQVVRLSVGGERFEYTLPAATMSEAKEFARREHTRLTTLHSRGVPLRYPVSRLPDEYETDHLERLRPKSRVGYEAEIMAARRYFCRKIRDPHVDRIRRADVRKFLKWRRVHTPTGQKRREPLSSRSVQKSRSILRTVFQRAVEDELIGSNPCDELKIKKPKRRQPVIIDDRQASGLLDECAKSRKNPHLFAYAVTLLETGAR